MRLARKHRQAGAPVDDRGALDSLGVGKIGELAARQTRGQRAQVGVLEDEGWGRRNQCWESGPQDRPPPKRDLFLTREIG